MSTFPNSPRLLKGGIVLLDPDTAAVQRIISLQYNPDTLTRSLQIQGVSADGAAGGDRSEILRLKGPPIETIKLEAEIDATDQLEFPDQNANAVEVGIHPQLAALEAIVYPTSDQLQSNNALAKSGTLEIIPMQSALTLFIWSKNRIIPVRLTDFSITEEAFDPNLNPIRAKVSLGMRVLSVSDVGFDAKAGSLYMTYQQQKERLAGARPRWFVRQSRDQRNSMSDQLQALLQQAGIATPAFPANSRYNKTPLASLTTPDGTEVEYLRRRFVPPPENFALLQEHTVTEGERLDHIAAKYLGDPEQFWRICDANGAISA